MKNRLFSILIALWITLTFIPNSLAQTLRDDPQQGDILDGDKVRAKRGQPNGVGIYDIKYSPDGTRLAVAGDFGILLYDVQMRGKNVQKDDKPVRLTGHRGRAVRIAYHPDGKILASGSPRGDFRLLDTGTRQLLRTFKGVKKLLISGVAFSPNGKMIASRHNERMEGSIRLWDADTGKLLRTLSGHTGIVYGMAFSPNGNIIASGGNDKTVRLWDVDTGKLLRTLSGHTERVCGMAFSPNGNIIVSGGYDYTLRLWNVNTGQLLRTLEVPTRCISYSVAFSPDGRTIASMNVTGVCLWDMRTEQLLRKFRERNVGYGVSVVEFSPDGKTLAVCGSFEVDLWDVETGQLLRRLKIPDYRR